MNELTVTLSSEAAEREYRTFVELKDRLENELQLYRNIIVDEQSYAACKRDQKDLAGMRNRIDTFRKNEKKKMEEPIKVFDQQCKELMGVVQMAVDNLNAGTSVFDEQRKAEKKEFAEKALAETVAAYGLSDKYASQLLIKPSYLNLTASMKGVRDDLAMEAQKLKSLQDEEERRLSDIRAFVQKENEERQLLTGLDPNEFCNAFLRGMPYVEVISYITKRAEGQQNVEQFVRETERKRAEEAAKAKMEEEKPTGEPVQQVNPGMPPMPPMPPVMPNANATEKDLWIVSFSVRGEKSVLSGLCQYMKTSGIEYKVMNQVKA